MVQSDTIYITRADKGGAILILDSTTVLEIIKKELEDTSKYCCLEKDPRPEIKKLLKNTVVSHEEEGLISPGNRFLITGYTDKGGMSQHPDFSISSPYVYPLFKIHKLSKEDIVCKKIPPTRMVTGSTGVPKYRLGVFLDFTLKPVVLQYCGNEYIKDTTHFIQRLYAEKDSFTLPGLVATLDFVPLYPTIRRDLLLLAVRHALQTSEYTEDSINMILDLVSLSIENSVVFFKGI